MLPGDRRNENACMRSLYCCDRQRLATDAQEEPVMTCVCWILLTGLVRTCSRECEQRRDKKNSRLITGSCTVNYVWSNRSGSERSPVEG
jgi:hypothetical protein